PASPPSRHGPGSGRARPRVQSGSVSGTGGRYSRPRDAPRRLTHPPCRSTDPPFVAFMSTATNNSSKRGRMGRIIATEFVSLDGVVEAPGGGEDFEYAGWSFEIERGEEGNKFKLDETFESDALLLGRKTYEGFAAAWPARKGEFADKFNRMPKYVVSSTMDMPEWSNTTVLRGDLAQEVGRLPERHDGP